MTTISGFIDGINSGAIPPEKHSYYLNIISGEVHRLSRLVSQLLDISKLESGDRKFVPAPFDVCETARLILISFEQRIEEKRLDILFETDADSMIAYADKDSIHQVMYNLCENAIKFSREEGMLRISIKRGEKNKLVISVYNEGAGIPREDLPLVFDRFYKSDKSRGLDKNGVGLGLYIVKTIVEAQGESISVQSEPGEYCEFVFTLEESDRKPDVRA
jgi:signal transduction histidine kinase